jgi:hypothetical protein
MYGVRGMTSSRVLPRDTVGQEQEIPSGALPLPEFAQPCGSPRLGDPRRCPRECLRAGENSREQATRRHRGCSSRRYRCAACSSDKASPVSSSASPAAISPICHSLNLTYAAIASAARNDLERLVLRANASSLASEGARLSGTFEFLYLSV